MKMDKIQDLKRKHFRIKENIKNHIRRKTDYSELLKQYIEICDQLKKEGVEVNDTSSYIKQALQSYTLDKKENSQKNSNNNFDINQKSLFQITLPPPPEQPQTIESLYKITVAWTERPGHEPDTTLKIIDDYLKENGATVFDNTEADFDGYKEIMRSYEWTGGEREFKILRRSANYILDVFAASQYEKFNISIFGSKKP